MSLSIASLNSGSNGNCYYIGNDEEAVLIDAGLSCKETEIRMKRLGLSMGRVKAVFISHEHSDHIFGISTLIKKYQIPVYFSDATLKKAGLGKIRDYCLFFTAHQPVAIGNLRITAFPKKHDACDPHSFVVNSFKINIGIFTDIGEPCDQLIHYFKQCNAAFLESNYDENMLHNGRYPFYLKKRISGGSGHLSNLQALEIYRLYRPSFMTHLLLSHLSKENNSPGIVESLFNGVYADTKIIVAGRDKETELYPIAAPVTISKYFLQKNRSAVKQQLSLF
jgi:phosphoribosyl 1,2-cyclic phosphodiesterase